jgi:PleD family two-component response regulator
LAHTCSRIADAIYIVDERHIDTAMGAGANDYLVKPGGWTKLRQVADSLVRQAVQHNA